MTAVTARIVAGVVILAAPFLLWLALYATARLFSVNLRRILPVIISLHLLTYGAGVVLMLINLANNHFPGRYAAALVACSAGLIFPETWLKRRFAPDLLPPADSEDGWWPSKPE